MKKRRYQLFRVMSKYKKISQTTMLDKNTSTSFQIISKLNNRYIEQTT